MGNKERALKISTVTLFVIAMIDLLRGFMHTFQINFAATNIAKIQATPDELILMGSFGMANFLSGILYLLVLKKAKHLAPYVLIIIPTAYLLGIIGLKMQGVHMQAEFNGQYMMYVYLGVSALVSGYYFILHKISKN